MKVEIDDVTGRCDLLLVQLLPEPEAAPLVRKRRSDWLECQTGILAADDAVKGRVQRRTWI